VTDREVRDFQRGIGVRADGIVGPLTWRGLISGMNSF
jgi:peptidoglycan hydrolase-like protein with peptidoglycan-binding domain